MKEIFKESNYDTVNTLINLSCTASTYNSLKYLCLRINILFLCSYYASTAFPVGPPRLVPPLKRQRLMSSTTRNKSNQSTKSNSTPPLDQLKVYSK